MRLSVLAPVAAILLLTACGQSGESPADPVAAESAPAASDIAAAPPKAAVALPSLAYSYQLGYRLPSDAIAQTMLVHRKLCADLGSGSCRLLAENLTGGDGSFLTGSLNFEVEAGKARPFTEALDASIAKADGEVSGRTVDAEDLARPIIDAQARITAKQALADRLLDLLKRRDGKVGELVDVERAFSDAQEELEAARGQLADMQRRVAMSRVTVSYQSNSLEGASSARPIRDAFASAGNLAARSFAGLITILAMLLPWATVAALAIWAFIRVRRWRQRTRNAERD